MSAKTVLLVDSHEDSRAIYTVILEHHGFGVVCASSPAEGARLARERRPDVIVLEYGYPADHAARMAALFRADVAMRRVPVVALSTASSEDERDRALAHGFTAYLVKPCAPLELLEEVRRLMGLLG
ncbi:MAG TPA: response regulator [Longimicrobium sp.]|nr:response regulator [Longimicrobium sp.]